MSRSKREAQMEALYGGPEALVLITERGGRKRDKRKMLDEKMSKMMARQPAPATNVHQPPDAPVLGSYQTGTLANPFSGGSGYTPGVRGAMSNFQRHVGPTATVNQGSMAHAMAAQSKRHQTPVSPFSSRMSIPGGPPAIQGHALNLNSPLNSPMGGQGGSAGSPLSFYSNPAAAFNNPNRMPQRGAPQQQQMRQPVSSARGFAQPRMPSSPLDEALSGWQGQAMQGGRPSDAYSAFPGNAPGQQWLRAPEFQPIQFDPIQFDPIDYGAFNFEPISFGAAPFGTGEP